MDKSSVSTPAIHRCEHCKKQFKTKTQLNAHQKIHLSTFDFKCNFCTYATNFKKSLFDHIRTHTKERPYKCTQANCNLAFTQKAHLIVHQLVHKKDDTNLYKFKCPNCDHKTMYKSSLDVHFITHSDLKGFSCDRCPFKTIHKGVLKRHHDDVHLKLKPFRCQLPDCNSVFSRKYGLNRHQLVHKKDDENLCKFKCLKCGYKTVDKGSLEKHSVFHLPLTLRPFRCPHQNCNNSCTRKAHLTSHLKIHDDDRPFVCTITECDFRTKWREALKKHEMVHRGERPFKCNFCHFRSNKMGHLDAHIRVHTGETPYPCQNCPYRGKTFSDVTMHVRRRHLGNKLESGLSSKKHISPEVPLKCKVPSCIFTAENDSHLAIHLNASH